MKYCGHCGRPLKDEARFCGFCGRECKSPSERNNPSNMDHKTQKKNSFKRLVAAFVVVAICITCIAAAVISRHKDQLSPVKNAEEAITQLEKLGKELGYDNALSELTEKSTTTIDGDSYYRLQQNYQGIPVYGRTVVYATNENGSPISITGNVEDLDSDISLIPAVTQEQVEASIMNYAMDNLELESNKDINIGKLSEGSMYIYNSDGLDRAKLAYCVRAGDYEFMVDAISGEVLCNRTQTVGFTNTEMLNANDIMCVKDQNGLLILKDETRKITVFEMNDINDMQSEIEEVFNDDTVLTVSSSADVSASVYTMVNVARAYDYYNRVLGRNGFDNQNSEIDVVMCTKNILSDQAKSNGFQRPALIFVGAPDSLFTEPIGKALDIIAHEYTHLILHTEVGFVDGFEQSAISEALCDVLGNIIEDSYKNETDVLWRLGEDGGYIKYSMAECVTMENYNPKDSGHENARILTYAAYLMWNGGIDGDNMKKISCEELAKLWYRGMLMMPSDCDFAECRTLVELAGKSMNLSDKQILCIKEAFDTVGIPDAESVDYKLSTDSTLCVYGADSELYGDYIIQIAGTRKVLKDGVELKKSIREMYNLSRLLVDEKYYETRYITTAEAIPFDLDVGTYTISLIDNQRNGDSVSFKVQIGVHDGKDNLNIYTNFSKHKLLRQANTYVNGVLESVTEFSYNEKGLITERAEYSFDEGFRNSESLFTYAYDDADRMIESISYSGSEKKWQKTSQYTYDDMGRLARYDYKAAPEWWGTTTYEYDAQGKLIRIKLESGKGNETAKQEILPDEDGHLVRHKVYIDNGKSYEVYDEYRLEVIHDGEYEPFTIYESILVQTGEKGDLVIAVLEDVMGNEICSFTSYSGDSELITDDEGYLVRINDEPRHSWDFEFTYLFHYDGDEALGRPPEEILDSSG